MPIFLVKQYKAYGLCFLAMAPNCDDDVMAMTPNADIISINLKKKKKLKKKTKLAKNCFWNGIILRVWTKCGALTLTHTHTHASTDADIRSTTDNVTRTHTHLHKRHYNMTTFAHSTRLDSLFGHTYMDTSNVFLCLSVSWMCRNTAWHTQTHS